MDKKMEISALQDILIVEITERGTSAGDDDDDDPRRAALYNPVILEQIFSYLDTDNIRTVRLLCKAWEAEGSIILGKRCVLPLHHIFNDYKTTVEPVPVNPKLLQHISILPSNYVTFKYPVPDNVESLCFTSFASTWHSAVQEIDVHMDIHMCLGLTSTLNDYAFPNLTTITIRTRLGIELDDHLPLAPINTLKEIKIIGVVGFLKSCSYLFLQNLIDSAPNLEVLKINGNFYPNLASCGKLKVLKSLGYLPTVYSLIEREFEPDEVLRMLNEVGERLERLSLGLGQISFAQGGVCYCINMRLPKLPKLKSLTIKYVLGMVEQICPSLLPNLQIVAFRGQHILDRSIRRDQGGYLTHDGVRSFEQFGIRRPDEITFASKKFPNVKRLTIEILESKKKNVNKAEYLGTTLRACSTWKLLYLELRIDAEITMSELLEGLKSLSVLEGIKQVRIVVDAFLFDDDLELDYDFQAFEDVLQLSAKMDRMIFEGLEFKTTTRKKVLEILRQHKDLPVFNLD